MKSRRTALSVGISASILAILVWLVDADELARTLSRVDPVIAFIGVVVLLASYLPVAVRWQWLYRATGQSVDFWSALEIVIVSYGANNLFPANSGDLARSKITERYAAVENHAEVLGLVLVERLYDVAVIGILLGLSSLALGPVYLQNVEWALVAVAATLFVTLILLRVGAIGRLTLALPDRIRPGVEEAIFAYRSVDSRVTLVTASTTVIRWLLLAGALGLFSLAFSIPIEPTLAVFVICAMGLAATLPLSPGGLGPVEAIGTGLLTLSGLSYEVSLSIIVLQRAAGLVLLSLVALAIYNYRTLFSTPQ